MLTEVYVIVSKSADRMLKDFKIYTFLISYIQQESYSYLTKLICFYSKPLSYQVALFSSSEICILGNLKEGRVIQYNTDPSINTLLGSIWFTRFVALLSEVTLEWKIGVKENYWMLFQQINDENCQLHNISFNITLNQIKENITLSRTVHNNYIECEHSILTIQWCSYFHAQLILKKVHKTGFCQSCGVDPAGKV